MPFDKDPLWKKTVLRLKLDGAHGTTTVVDSSANALTPTVAGTVGFSNLQSLLGTTSLRFTGGGGGVEFTHASMAPTNATSLELTVRGWFYFEALGTVSILFDGYSDAVSMGCIAWVEADGRFFVGGLGTTQNSIGSVVALNTWVHIAVVRDTDSLGASHVRGYVNGVQVLSGPAPLTNLSNTRFTIGRHRDGSSSPFLGFIEDFEYTTGYARYRDGNSFSPPARLPVAEGLSGAVANRGKIKDIHYGGRGRIAATVKESASPSNHPLHRRVLLMREREGLVVRETWSDADTGAYSFDYIDEAVRYSSISFDHSHAYRSVIADNLAPDLMP